MTTWGQNGIRRARGEKASIFCSWGAGKILFGVLVKFYFLALGFGSGLLLIVASVAWIYEQFIDALEQHGVISSDTARRNR
jgi:hypothetical protein